MLKPGILAVALILLLVGLIFLAIFNVSVTSFNETMLEHKESAREISGFFNQGEKIILKFWPNEKWKDAPFETPLPDIDYPHVFLYFNVTGPQNVNASFEVTIIRTEFNSTPYVYQIIVLEHGRLTESIASTNKTMEIGGIVNQSGNYTARFEGVFPPIQPPGNLPESLTLYKGIPQESLPYTYLLPIGVVMIILSFILLIWNIRTSKRVVHYKSVALSKH
jgi:hypothetical protein